MTRRPDFFIVGAPRCGTTAMQEYLAQHPEIYMPSVKDPHYFGSDLAPLRSGLCATEAKYLALFDDALPGQRVGEASALYLYSRQAAEEIRSFRPDAKIVVMLRDPVEMIHSLHAEWLSSGTEDIPSLAAALDAQHARRAGANIPRSASFPGALQYTEIARFAVQLDRFHRAFGRENVHVCLLDDVKADPASAYGRICRFLRVSEAFRPDFRVVNAQKVPRPGIIRSAWLGLPYRARQRLKALAPRALYAPLRRTLVPQMVRTAPGIPLDDTTRERLARELAPEVRRLEALLGRPLSTWAQPPPSLAK